MTQQPSTFAFKGGLDITSPALAVPASYLVSGINYEPLAEGYGRVQGHERWDGRLPASDAQFWLLDFHSGSQPIFVGDTLTGATSGATAYVVLNPVNTSGVWGSGTRAGSLVLSDVVGTFVTGEQLRVGGVTHAIASGTANADSAPTEDARQLYSAAAQAQQRSLIQPVPGIGPVRGVALLDGTLYAWRDWAGGAEARMYRATPLGWSRVALNRSVPFTAGVHEFEPGDTITGATSGGTAVVERIIRQSGDWGTDAAGYLILSAINGLTGPESVKVGGTAVATISVITDQVLPPGGRYMTINHNFYGASDRYAMYGCNGVGTGFEFDGTVFTSISTGMVDDRPQRVFEINNYLGFTFPGGSIQFSSVTSPLDWDPITGAGEIGFGSEITDVVQAAQTAVLFFGAQKISFLEGTDRDTFILKELTEEAGGDPWTAQKIGRIMYLDARGLRDVNATQSFGNFKAGTLSQLIEPYFRAKRKVGARAVTSHVCRSKSQYRLYWNDATGLTVYMGGKNPEAIPFSTGAMQVYCSAIGEMADGEAMFVGAQDGYVYRMDSGTSFDGVGVKGFCMTPYNHLGAVAVEKRLHKVSLEMQAAPLTQIGLTVMFDYSDGTQPNAGSQDFTVQGVGDGIEFRVTGGGGIWDTSLWNEFFWSAAYSGTAAAYPDGCGVNMSLIIACESEPAEPPHILQSYTMLTSPRRLRR